MTALEAWGVKETLKWNRGEDIVEQVKRKPHQEGQLCKPSGSVQERIIERWLNHLTLLPTTERVEETT